MKKKLLLLLLLVTAFTNAQIVNIPDTAFKDRLLLSSTVLSIAKDSNENNFAIDANNDGEIQVSEALEVFYLNVGNSGSSDLTGIQAFTNLVQLSCSGNNLTILDITQNTNLKYLSCGSNDLTTLDITQNVNLEVFNCNYNDLTSLNITQNTNLQWFHCTNNQLSNLDVTQNTNLEWLYCNDNQLTSLDLTQNSSLWELRCHNNQLTSLDVTQNTHLEELYCNDNQLTSLNLTQNTSLWSLRCHNNQLTTLDLIENTSLWSLHCHNNQLETLFIKNDSIESESYLNFSNNPNLTYICADEDQLTSLQAQAGPSVVVNSYCSFTPEGNYNTISGVITLDANSNGCGASDVLQPNIRVDINDGTNQGTSVTNSSGNYSFYTGAGSFDITPNLESLTWFTVSPTIATIPFADADNNSTTQDFCITPNGVHPDVKVVISPIVAAQPGFDAVYNVNYKNKGNQTLSGAVDITFNDSVLDYVSASISPDIQTTGNLSWIYTDLLPFESRSIALTLNVNSPMETPAVNIDDVLNFIVTVNPVADDELPEDNIFELNQTVVGSFDPNDITCLEGDTVNPDKIGEYLHYNINFENTGTAAATFVVVKDVIDETLYDMGSLQIMYASHEMQTRITNNTIEFIFDNINLGPDEKGNVLFKIKTNNTLTVGDSVENDAEIFFDYNFPIETNIATTNFQVLSIDEFGIDDSISIFPNPSKDIVTLSSQHNLKSIQVYDAMSRLVFESALDDANYTLNVSNFSKGIFFIKLKTAIGEKVERFVKN
ncbi:DUF7619 domain-containing protein [Winogradskyella schleiferi]|uniref:DUF7619 domain-containing protein n=1 Tax=Winogradskyella schleiferi TaxID=2686078 RepID=UPI0015C00892|nr:T9SS type A sorting domain-containing protein [Winogradskyella schleiferi]